MENDVEEKRCLKISGFVVFGGVLAIWLKKSHASESSWWFCSFGCAPTYSPPACHCFKKIARSTIPIVSVVWRVPVPPEVVTHHCMSHHQRSAGQRPDRTWHSQRKQLPSIQCWKSQILSCNEQMLGIRTDKSKRKVLPMLSTEDKYSNHIGWEISHRDADSNRKATIEDQKSKSKESSTWCLHSMLALWKNPCDLAIPFLCEANLATFCCHASSLSSHACWGAGRGGSPELRDASTGDWFGNTKESVKCFLGSGNLYQMAGSLCPSVIDWYKSWHEMACIEMKLQWKSENAGLMGFLAPPPQFRSTYQ